MSADADELFPARDEATFVAAARALMIADENAALVTVDDDGQPRVRSVRVFLEDPETDDPVQRLTGWIMTRLSTRKVSQVRRSRW